MKIVKKKKCKILVNVVAISLNLLIIAQAIIARIYRTIIYRVYWQTSLQYFVIHTKLIVFNCFDGPCIRIIFITIHKNNIICYTIYNSYNLLYLFTDHCSVICIGLDFLDNGSIFEHAITCAGNTYFFPHRSYDTCGYLYYMKS